MCAIMRVSSKRASLRRLFFLVKNLFTLLGLGLGAGEVREGAVRFSHTVAVFLLLEGGTGFVVSVDNFSFKTLRVWHALASASALDEPREGEVLLAVARNWERNLIVSTTDAARFNFKIRRNVRDSLLKDSNRVFGIQFLRGTFESGINSALSGLLFTVKHRFVDQALNQDRLIFAIWHNFALERRSNFAWHRLFSLLRAVFRTALFTTLNALEIEGPADDMVADTWKIWHTTTADKHNSVLLEVVAFTTDVSPDFLTVSQANTSDFAKRGVRFLRGLGSDFKTDAAFKRGSLFIALSLKRVNNGAERRSL